MLPRGSDSAFAGGQTLRPLPDAATGLGTVQRVEDAESPTLVPEGVRSELVALLVNDPRQLGAVYRQVSAGVTAPRDIVEAGAAKNTGAVSNLRQTLAALLERTIPESASIARQAAAAIGAFLNDDSISDETRNYLTTLREELVAASRSTDALQHDAATVEAADRELSRRAEDLSGVYVYSFLHYLQYPNDPDTGRCWLKVGSTTKGAWKRVLEQTRQTSMPEDPKLLRIYHSATLTPAEIEARFHAVLDAAGHERSAATHTKAGKEWFSTTVELLDTLANAMSLTVELLEESSNSN